MKNQIEIWLNFLSTSLSLFTVDDRRHVLHPTHTPCSNTAGDLVFELNRSFHLYLTMVTDQYRQHSDSAGDDGELDFLFATITTRQDQDLPSNLWVVPITEVENTTDHERMLFVCSELSRAVDYLRNFFDEFYDPESPPWKVDPPDICWDCEHNRLNSCPFGNSPNIVSGQCVQWVTNPDAEYDERAVAAEEAPKDINGGVEPWDKPGADLDPIPKFQSDDESPAEEPYIPKGFGGIWGDMSVDLPRRPGG